MLIFQNPHLQ